MPFLKIWTLRSFERFGPTSICTNQTSIYAAADKHDEDHDDKDYVSFA